MSRVLVAGSINMDVVATTEHHPRPGETVPGKRLHFFPGGKGANQAVAAAKLGARVFMIGKLGSDDFGDQLERFLKKQGVDLSYVQRTHEAATGTALIVVDDTSENTIVVVHGANGLVNPEDVDAVDIEKDDILLSQFEIPLNTIKIFFAKGREIGATIILNPAPAKACPKELLGLADILVVNETELAFFLNEATIGHMTIESIANYAKQLRAHREQVIIVTLGENGAVAVAGERQIRVPGHKVKAMDATGAGDCFVGALAAKLASGSTLDEALKYANTAASICVQRMGAGTSMPTFDEVEDEIFKDSV